MGVTELRAVTPTGGAVTRVIVPIPPAVHDVHEGRGVELQATYVRKHLESRLHVHALLEPLV